MARALTCRVELRGTESWAGAHEPREWITPATVPNPPEVPASLVPTTELGGGEARDANAVAASIHVRQRSVRPEPI
eukprot:scaffold4916_cov28-Tisochrysis_lutea.AAC.3